MQQQGKDKKLSTYTSRAEYFKNRRANLKKLVVELTIEERNKLEISGFIDNFNSVEQIVTKNNTTIRGWIVEQIEKNY